MGGFLLIMIEIFRFQVKFINQCNIVSKHSIVTQKSIKTWEATFWKSPIYTSKPTRWDPTIKLCEREEEGDNAMSKACGTPNPSDFLKQMYLSIYDIYSDIFLFPLKVLSFATNSGVFSLCLQFCDIEPVSTVGVRST